jgi:hypothetical protein
VNGNVHTPVTETLVDVPLDAGIQRLTRWYSALNYGDGRESRPRFQHVELAAIRTFPIER